VRRAGVRAPVNHGSTRSAAVVGLAQLVAGPLRPGDVLVVRGSLPRGGEILLRGIIGKRFVEAQFGGAGLLMSGRAKIRLSKRGNFCLRTRQGRLIKPKRTNTVEIRAP
jgi:hypothetical protein